MPDITTQWDNRITGNGLNESPASYYTFKIWCRNPEWTLKELAENTNRKYKQVRDWSSKYHYKSRKQAYITHIHEELEEQELIIKTRMLENKIKRQNKDNEILLNDQQILQTLQNGILIKMDDNQIPDKESIQNYTTIKDSYYKSAKDDATETLTIFKAVETGINPQDYDKDEMSPAARALVEQFERITEDDKE